MSHSITIGGKNTWEDWHLVPTAPPVVNPPAVKTEIIEIPGLDGVLDLTEVLADSVPYGQREGTWEFALRPGTRWAEVYNSLLADLHGQRLRVVLEDKPDGFYQGRVRVDRWSSEPARSRVVLCYSLEPYKYSIAGTGEQDWLWSDLFSNIIYYGTFDVAGEKARNLINPSGKTLTPDITCSAAMNVTVGGELVSLPKGKSRQITLSPGDNLVTFAGTGRVNVDYALEKSL